MHLNTAFLKPVKKTWQAARNRGFSEAHEHLFRPDRRNPDSTPTVARDSIPSTSLSSLLALLSLALPGPYRLAAFLSARHYRSFSDKACSPSCTHLFLDARKKYANPLAKSNHC